MSPPSSPHVFVSRDTQGSGITMPPSPVLQSHPFLQPRITPASEREGSIKSDGRGTTYYTPLRASSEHHVSLYGVDNRSRISFPMLHDGNQQEGRPESIISVSGSVAASVALTARQRPPSAPPRSVRGATGERIVGGIQRTPIAELSGPTPAMEFAAAAAPLVAPVRKQREEESSMQAASLKSQQEWEEKVIIDLQGWKGGSGKPYSSSVNTKHTYNSYNGTYNSYNSYNSFHKVGVVGVDPLKQILRVQRDRSSGGNICQFMSTLPPQLEGRLSPAAFSFFVETVNVHLRDAYSLSGVIVDNIITVASLWTSPCWRANHFEKELRRAEEVIIQANKRTFNPKGLNVRSPRDSGLQYLEIEFY